MVGVSARRSISFILLFIVILVAGCSKRESAPEAVRKPQAYPAIVFMTDFGTANDAVAICKAVILGIAPNALIMDITHQVNPYSVEEGARFLADVTPYYPSRTVFLVVVDPGVGTSRKAIIVKSKKGQFFVLPDNGLITPVGDRDGVEGAREITNPAWMLGSFFCARAILPRFDPRRRDRSDGGHCGGSLSRSPKSCQ